MQLHKILTYASFLLIFIGVAGFAGTAELEPVNKCGITTALLLIVAGILCGVWAVWENGDFRRTSHKR
ncbi:MAG: hypothetical protein HDR11_15425 [Lachnospiraceae bacterium]|nr:hypothetical protein [Lachnospiraceae bacterium]